MSEKASRRKRGLGGSVIFTLLLSYILIVSIPMSIIGVLYLRASQTIADQNARYVAQQADHTRAAFESSIADASNYLNMLLSDDDMRSLIYGRNPLTVPELTSSVVEAQKRLYTLSRGQRMARDVILFHENERFIVTSESIYLRLELFPLAYQHTIADYDWAMDFFDTLDLGRPYSREWFVYPSADGSTSMLVCASAIVSEGHKVFVALPLAISDLLESLVPEYAGTVIALDDSGRCMTRNSDLLSSLSFDQAAGTAQDAAGGQYLFSETSTICGIRLINLHPYADAEDSAAGLRTSFGVMLVFVVVSSIALCLLMTFLQTRPVYHILQLLHGSSRLSHYSWELLTDRIARLIEDNQSMADDQRRRLSETRQELVDALFTRAADPDEIVARMDALGLMPRGAFSLLTILFESPEDCGRARALLPDRLPGLFGLSCVDDRTLAVLLRADEDDVSALERKLTPMLSSLRSENAEGSQIALDSLPSLSCADIILREQLMMMRLVEDTRADDRLIHISNDIFGDQDIFFPAVLEQQLISGILAGNREQTAATLEAICQENFSVRRVTDIKSRLLLERLTACVTGPLLRVAALPDETKLSAVSALSKCRNQSNYLEFPEAAMEILSPLLSAVRANAEEPRRSQKGAEIIAFLRERFADPALSLGTLAARFDMSENYVSGIIRDETGEPFKAYLDRLRVSQARALIDQGASSQEACERAGFSSPSTFRRTFKKLVGLTPSDYAQDSKTGPQE